MTMRGYDPVEPIDVLEKELGTHIIKMDGNENPYLCSPRATQILANFPYYHIYPDPLQRNLRKALSSYTGFSESSIVCGNGSDDLIDLVLRLFVRPGDEVLNCPPTFGMYPFTVGVVGGTIVNVPRRDDFVLDMAGIRAAKSDKTRVIFIASPNNPTGELVSDEEVLELLGMGLVVVVDEAYFEFGESSAAGLVAANPNLIILRTFSKWAGLAGLRVGYGLCHEKIAGHFLKIKQPYNVNVAGEAAAIASLEDVDYLRANVERLKAERNRMSSELAKLPWMRPFPSSANFVLCRVAEKDASGAVTTARRLRDSLRKRGILVRFYETPGLRDCLRISAGRPEDTDALLTGLVEAWNEA
ncbi:MAG: histidinol-phosphate transaminase [Dehalococcoidia bacterium]|nr:histidinol-phosphate transaminase [Dehalococcoidia bacterium]